jgi:hypothetical protein
MGRAQDLTARCARHPGAMVPGRGPAGLAYGFLVAVGVPVWTTSGGSTP